MAVWPPFLRKQTVASANPIAAARLPAADTSVPNSVWSTAGVAGGIPTSRTRCTTGTGTSVINAYTGTAAAINTAISGCDANHFIELGAGDFTLSSTIIMGTNNITLKGQGADQTRLLITGSTGGCGVGFVDFAIRGCCNGANIGTTNGGFSGPTNTATWDAGYSAGTATITLSAHANLSVGGVLWLDQLNDASDGGDLFHCEDDAPCSADGGNHLMRVGRAQAEGHVVTACGTSTPGAACTSNSVTIDPPVMAPNFNSGQTPGAWWGNMSGGSQDIVTGLGFEDFLLEYKNASSIAGIALVNATNSWVKGVSVIRTGDTASFLLHVYLINGFRNTIANSYFYGAEDTGSGNNTTNYALAMYSGSCQLVQNNIFHACTEPIELAGVEEGTVFGYNFETGSWFSSSGIQDHQFAMHVLSEGNNWGVRICDNNHGQSYFQTMFRDHYAKNNGNGSTNAAVALLTHCRFFNIVGSVFASTGWDTYAPTDLTNSNTGIFVTGWEGNCSNCGLMSTDSNVKRTLYRWGNWDNVTSSNDTGTNDQTGTRFNTGEVPSGITSYANPVPASQTLPTSLYLSAKPSFLGSLPWPLIGPDVSSGIISSTGGHANKTAAQVCFEASTNHGSYGSTSPRVKTGVASACATP